MLLLKKFRSSLQWEFMFPQLSQTPFATGIVSPCCTQDLKNEKRSMGFLHHSQGAAHWAWADLGLFPDRRECVMTLSGPVTGLWQGTESPRAVSHPGPTSSAHTFSSCQLLSLAVDIIHQITLQACLFPFKDEFPSRLKSRGPLSVTSLGLSSHLVAPWEEGINCRGNRGCRSVPRGGKG